MNLAHDTPLTLTEGRFARFELIEWWDQARLRDARVLVVGAGALGNEVVKNLALLGVGTLAIVDVDRVEKSNLCRSVLFRESDEGRPKALCAAAAAGQLYPEIKTLPLVGNVQTDVGLGHFRAADVVVGAIDNREARVFVNAACARVGRPWIDGGIEVLRGIVRGFAPPATACYECTMNRTDWELLNRRRSCSLLGRRAAQRPRRPHHADHGLDRRRPASPGSGETPARDGRLARRRLFVRRRRPRFLPRCLPDQSGVRLA